MSKKPKDYELKTAAKLLELAGDWFSRQGLDSFKLDFLSEKEKKSLLEEYENWNGTPEEFNPEAKDFPHWALMYYLSEQFDDSPSDELQVKNLPRRLHRRNIDEMGTAINKLVDWFNGRTTMNLFEVNDVILEIAQRWQRFKT